MKSEIGPAGYSPATAEKIETLRRWIRESAYTVFFGGAGVSTESGIPDFRSKDGLYNQRDIRFENYSPEYLLSHTCLIREPEVFFSFYRQKMDSRRFKPNRAHIALADLERRGKLQAVITQNIDGLHQRAGSRAVYEIHGTTRRNYCLSCGKEYPPDAIFDSAEPVPRCDCGGIIRCDVTLYEEALPEEAVEHAIHSIRKAELLIVGGTSLTVYPAASYVTYFRGEHLVIINRDPLSYPLRPGRDLQILESIGGVLSAAAED
ncbi:MAG: NAD-dependent protein deacylase [Clostridia bacterium]|nr:NAD-dependent protein deacylase [Clostridia bacterium]